MFEIFKAGDWNCNNCDSTFPESKSIGSHLYTCLQLGTHSHTQQGKQTLNLDSESESNSEDDEDAEDAENEKFECSFCSKSFPTSITLALNPEMSQQ